MVIIIRILFCIIFHELTWTTHSQLIQPQRELPYVGKPPKVGQGVSLFLGA